MDKLEQITERLRRQTPMVADEGAFVDDIMALIDSPQPRIPMWLKGVRAVSSMAATFLVVLYVWQQLEVVDSSAPLQPGHMAQSIPDVRAQEPEIIDRNTAMERIDKYLSDREKRNETKKHSITHNYARL